MVPGRKGGWQERASRTSSLVRFIEHGARPLGSIEQIRAYFSGASFGLGCAPSGDLAVISAQKNLRDARAAEFGRSCVLREFQDAIASRERVIPTALFVPENTWDESDCSIDDDHRGNLATVENKVTDAQFRRFEDLDDAMVEAFVASAQKNQSASGRKFFDDRLIEPTSLGCEQHQFCGSRIDRSEGLDTPHDRLDADEHAGSSPIGSVVDLVVFLIG